MQVLDNHEFLQYREYSFLSHPNVPRQVLWNRETVYFHASPSPPPPVYSTGAVVVVDGSLTDSKLRHSLATVEDARLLHFENIEPHSFAGFDDAKVSA